MTAKQTRKSTPRSRTREETVAEEEPREDEAVGATSDVVEESAPPVEAEPEASDDVPAVDEAADAQPFIAPNRPGKGMCDNHPDREAVLVTDFPWSSPQRFCNLCVPPQYRYLLP